MIWGNDQSNNPGQTIATGNGNANANIFWEEPVKQMPTVKLVQQNGTSKPLSKSQTVSNMQSAANNAKSAQNAAKTTTISKTNSSGNVSTAVNSTSNNINKKAKIGNTNAKKGTHTHTNTHLFKHF